MLNKDSDDFDAIFSQITVVSDETLKWFEKTIIFVDSVVFYELFVFFDDFADKRFDWFNTALTTFWYVLKVAAKDLLDCLHEFIVHILLYFWCNSFRLRIDCQDFLFQS